MSLRRFVLKIGKWYIWETSAMLMFFLIFKKKKIQSERKLSDE